MRNWSMPASGQDVSFVDLKWIYIGGKSYTAIGRFYLIKRLNEMQQNNIFGKLRNWSQHSNKRVFKIVSATKLVHRMCKPERRTYDIIKRKEKNTIVQPIQYNILPTPYIYKCIRTRVYSFGSTRSLLRLTVANVDDGRRDFSIILYYYIM